MICPPKYCREEPRYSDGIVIHPYCGRACANLTKGKGPTNRNTPVQTGPVKATNPFITTNPFIITNPFTPANPSPLQTHSPLQIPSQLRIPSPLQIPSSLQVREIPQNLWVLPPLPIPEADFHPQRGVSPFPRIRIRPTSRIDLPSTGKLQLLLVRLLDVHLPFMSTHTEPLAATVPRNIGGMFPTLLCLVS